MDEFFTPEDKNKLFEIWSLPINNHNFRAINQLYDQYKADTFFKNETIKITPRFFSDPLTSFVKEMVDIGFIMKENGHYPETDDKYKLNSNRVNSFLVNGGFCKTTPDTESPTIKHKTLHQAVSASQPLTLLQKEDIVLKWLVESGLGINNDSSILSSINKDKVVLTPSELLSILNYLVDSKRYVYREIRQGTFTQNAAFYKIAEEGKLFWNSGKGGFENESTEESKMKEKNNQNKNTIIIHGDVHGGINQDVNYTSRTTYDKEAIKYPNKHAPILTIIKSFIVKVWDIIWFHPVPSSIIAAICFAFIIAFIKWKFKLTFLN